MATNDEQILLNFEEMIDLSLRPQHINFNLLHTILRIISAKLQLNKTVIIVNRSSNLTLPKYSDTTLKHDEPEIYQIVNGGDKLPISLENFELQKTEKSDIPLDTLVRLSKNVFIKEEQIQRSPSKLHNDHQSTATTANEQQQKSGVPSNNEQIILNELDTIKTDLNNLKEDYTNTHNICKDIFAQYELLANKMFELERQKRNFDDLRQTLSNISNQTTTPAAAAVTAKLGVVTGGGRRSNLIRSVGGENKIKPIQLENVSTARTTYKDLKNINSNSDDGDKLNSLNNVDYEKCYAVITKDVLKLRNKISAVINTCNDYFSKLDARLANAEKSIKFERECKKLLSCYTKDSPHVTMNELKPIEKQQKLIIKDLCNSQKTLGLLSNRVEDLVNCLPQIQDNLKQLIDKQLQYNAVIDEHSNNINDMLKWKITINCNLDKLIKNYDNLKVQKSDQEEINYLMKIKVNNDELTKYLRIDYFQTIENDLRYGIYKCMMNNDELNDNIKKFRDYIECLLDKKYDKSQVAAFKNYFETKLDDVLKYLNEIQNKCSSIKGCSQHSQIAAGLCVTTPISKVKGNSDGGGGGVGGHCLSCTTEAELNPFTGPIFGQQKEQSHNNNNFSQLQFLSVNRYCGGSHTKVDDNDKKNLRNKKI